MGTKAKFEGNMGTNTILANREHKKTNCRFGGSGQFISGEQGNRYLLESLTDSHTWSESPRTGFLAVSHTSGESHSNPHTKTAFLSTSPGADPGFCKES